MEHEQTEQDRIALQKAYNDENHTHLSQAYFQPRNSFWLTVVMGLLFIGMAWGGCELIRWVVL